MPSLWNVGPKCLTIFFVLIGCMMLHRYCHFTLHAYLKKQIHTTVSIAAVANAVPLQTILYPLGCLVRPLCPLASLSCRGLLPNSANNYKICTFYIFPYSETCFLPVLYTSMLFVSLVPFLISVQFSLKLFYCFSTVIITILNLVKWLTVRKLVETNCTYPHKVPMLHHILFWVAQDAAVLWTKRCSFGNLVLKKATSQGITNLFIPLVYLLPIAYKTINLLIVCCFWSPMRLVKGYLVVQL